MITWGDNGQWCTMTAQGDVVRGPQRVKAVVWYATSATAGSTLFQMREFRSGTIMCADVADSAQLARVQLSPVGLIQGIEISDMDAGYVIAYFEERPAEKVTAKGIHDASPLVPEE